LLHIYGFSLRLVSLIYFLATLGSPFTSHICWIHLQHGSWILLQIASAASNTLIPYITRVLAPRYPQRVPWITSLDSAGLTRFCAVALVSAAAYTPPACLPACSRFCLPALPAVLGLFSACRFWVFYLGGTLPAAFCSYLLPLPGSCLPPDFCLPAWVVPACLCFCWVDFLPASFSACLDYRSPSAACLLLPLSLPFLDAWMDFCWVPDSAGSGACWDGVPAPLGVLEFWICLLPASACLLLPACTGSCLNLPVCYIVFSWVWEFCYCLLGAF